MMGYLKRWITGCIVGVTVFASVASADTAVYFIHNDHLGTPQVVTNQSQSVVWEADYSPFGEVEITNEQVSLNARFPGQYADEESGVYYNYYRDYDPSIGRYIQSDPIGLNGGINTYGYVNQNPIIYTDVYGLAVYLCSQPAFGIPWNPIDHQWLRTDTIEAGMGPAINDCGNAGNELGDYPGDPVQVCDHSQRDMTGASCELVNNVDENIVNEQLEFGRPLGRWWPWNQCQSFAAEVLRNASTRTCTQTQRGMRCR